MRDTTSRRIVALGAATIIGCSQYHPAAPTDLAGENGRRDTEAEFAASLNDTLASIPLMIAFGVNAIGVTSVRLFLGFPDLPIFDVILHGHTHRMVVAGSSTPGFDTIIARLTDHVDDVMSFRSVLLPNGVGSGPDDNTLQSILLRDVNLQGASIKRIRLRIEDFSVVSPGSDPNGDGLWTDYRLIATLLIED